jgi:hypothetical protein
VRFKHWVRMFGLIGMGGMAITFLAVFIIAYISPSKQVTLDINYFNEATFELVLFITLIPCMVYTFIYTFDKQAEVAVYEEMALQHECR